MGKSVTTVNYAYLESDIETSHDAFIVADVTSYPHDLVKRCNVLLWCFLEKYVLSGNDYSALINALRYNGEKVKAELESIHEQLILAEQMLSECQSYADNFDREGTEGNE